MTPMMWFLEQVVFGFSGWEEQVHMCAILAQFYATGSRGARSKRKDLFERG
jgi:hypothetical protein